VELVGDEKRFPPPGNEVGYREAAPQIVVEPTAQEVPPAKKRVVATLANDPEVALRHASVEDVVAKQNAELAEREARIARSRRNAGIFILLLVLLYTVVSVISMTSPPRRRR
jgi:hypothetical protein